MKYEHDSNPNCILTHSISSNNNRGAGGMFDTRDPAAFKHEDPRKSIAEAPSFEEYLKSRKD